MRRNTKKPFKCFWFSMSIHDILCEVFLGEAIKAAI